MSPKFKSDIWGFAALIDASREASAAYAIIGAIVIPMSAGGTY